jgi:hypothetical protein
MLPPEDICIRKIKAFKTCYPRSQFNSFWRYKKKLEKGGATLLDNSHLDETAACLAGMLNDGDWGIARTGIPSTDKIKSILRGIAKPYEKIRQISISEGKLWSVRTELASIYVNLTGISHTRWSDPDEFNSYYIVGKPKVLMFIWGQTPGFDELVREQFDSLTHAPPPYVLPYLCLTDKRYTPQQFCEILEELDNWVQAWPNNNRGKTIQSLCPEWPVGRIIDVIYWVKA